MSRDQYPLHRLRVHTAEQLRVAELLAGDLTLADEKPKPDVNAYPRVTITGGITVVEKLPPVRVLSVRSIPLFDWTCNRCGIKSSKSMPQPPGHIYYCSNECAD